MVKRRGADLLLYRESALVGQLLEIAPIGSSRRVKDVTRYGEDRFRYQLGTFEGNEVELRFATDPDDLTRDALYADQEAGGLVAFEVFQPYAGELVSFSALVLGVREGIPLDGLWTYSARLKINAPGIARTQGAGTVQRSAAINATAAISAIGTTPVISRQAAISASAAIDVTGEVSGVGEAVERAASIDATAAIEAAPQRVLARQAALGLTGTIDSRGEGPDVLADIYIDVYEDIYRPGDAPRSADLTATAAIATAPRRELSRQAAIGATAAITATFTPAAPTFPVDAARQPTGISAASAFHTVQLPTGIVTGSLVIIVGRIAGNRTTTWPAGWQTYLNDGTRDWHDVDLDAADDRITAVYRVCDGTEGASIIVGLSASDKGSYIAYRISGHEDPSTQAPEILSAIGNTAGPDSPSLTPAGGLKNYLVLSLDTHAGEQTTVVTPPIGYTNTGQVTSGTGGQVATNCQINYASRQVAASVENPGAYVISASGAWTALTIVIHPRVGALERSVGIDATAGIASVGSVVGAPGTGIYSDTYLDAYGAAPPGGVERAAAIDATAAIASAPQRLLVRSAAIGATAAISVVPQGQVQGRTELGDVVGPVVSEKGRRRIGTMTETGERIT